MSNNEYVPSEEDFIDSWACAHVTPHDMTADEAKDAARDFLARVRHEAKAEAWDEGASEGVHAATLVFSMDLSIPPPLRNPYPETGDQ